MLTFLKNLLKNGEAVATAILVAAICCLGLSCVHLKRELASEIDERQAQAAQAAMCRASVDALEAERKEHEAAAKKALAEAQAEANKYALRADQLLRKPAAVPGDDCASAKVRAAAWLKSRGQ